DAAGDRYPGELLANGHPKRQREFERRLSERPKRVSSRTRRGRRRSVLGLHVSSRVDADSLFGVQAGEQLTRSFTNAHGAGARRQREGPVALSRVLAQQARATLQQCERATAARNRNVCQKRRSERHLLTRSQIDRNALSASPSNQGEGRGERNACRPKADVEQRRQRAQK